jgi:hypothetical protein
MAINPRFTKPRSVLSFRIDKLLQKIARQLSGLPIEDATKTERRIMESLMENGIGDIIVDKYGEKIYMRN